MGLLLYNLQEAIFCTRIIKKPNRWAEGSIYNNPAGNSYYSIGFDNKKKIARGQTL